MARDIGCLWGYVLEMFAHIKAIIARTTVAAIRVCAFSRMKGERAINPKNFILIKQKDLRFTIMPTHYRHSENLLHPIPLPLSRIILFIVIFHSKRNIFIAEDKYGCRAYGNENA